MASTSKILLIEDDEPADESLSEILTLSRYEVCKTSNGLKGIEIAIKERPDLIICDLQIPGLDGFGVLNILSRHPLTRSIPFIFISAASEKNSNLRKAMNMGADDYLLKPVSLLDLLTTVEIRLRKLSINAGKFEPSAKPAESNLLNLIENQDIRNYKQKHLLYGLGEKISHVYFVLTGKLKGFLIDSNGKELITNLYSSGDFISCTSIIGNSSYFDSVIVQQDAQLVLIPKTDFQIMLDYDSGAAADFIVKLSKQITEKEDRILNMAYYSLRKKVADGIISVYDKFKDEEKSIPVIRISRDDLAKVIGASPESVIRTLKEFKIEKLIEIFAGLIYVIDEKKLRHLPN